MNDKFGFAGLSPAPNSCHVKVIGLWEPLIQAPKDLRCISDGRMAGRDVFEATDSSLKNCVFFWEHRLFALESMAQKVWYAAYVSLEMSSIVSAAGISGGGNEVVIARQQLAAGPARQIPIYHSELNKYDHTAVINRGPGQRPGAQGP